MKADLPAGTVGRFAGDAGPADAGGGGGGAGGAPEL